jgi:hypothetical protein
MIGLEQEVRIGGNRVGHVDHRSRPDQPGQRNRVDRETGAAGRPVGRRVEMRPGVLAGMDVVPPPQRPGVIEVADLFQAEMNRVGERWRQPEHRSVRGERRRQIDHLQRARGDLVQQLRQHRHLSIRLPRVVRISEPHLVQRF